MITLYSGDVPRFSLIVATLDRVEELGRLIESLQSNSVQDFELIVVDQNDDGRLEPLFEAATLGDRLRVVRCPPGVSRARNLGWSIARGEIIAFPDDDCSYPSQLLQIVSDWFDLHPQAGLLSVASRDAEGNLSGNRWRRSPVPINAVNVFRTSVCYCLFFRRAALPEDLRFDEQLGPGAGSKYLASEDTDLVLMAMRKGVHGIFDSSQSVVHPRKDVKSLTVTSSRTRIYGRGMGFVLRKHGLFLLGSFFVFYDVVRGGVMVLAGRRTEAALWFRHGEGVMLGLLQF